VIFPHAIAPLLHSSHDMRLWQQNTVLEKSGLGHVIVIAIGIEAAWSSWKTTPLPNPIPIPMIPLL